MGSVQGPHLTHNHIAVFVDGLYPSQGIPGPQIVPGKISPDHRDASFHPFQHSIVDRLLLERAVLTDQHLLRPPSLANTTKACPHVSYMLSQQALDSAVPPEEDAAVPVVPSICHQALGCLPIRFFQKSMDAESGGRLGKRFTDLQIP